MFPLHHKVSYGHPGTCTELSWALLQRIKPCKVLLVLKTDVFFIKVVAPTAYFVDQQKPRR